MTETPQAEAAERAFALPRPMNHDACRDLAEFVAAHRGAPVAIEAAGAGTIGALAVQILAMAAQAWAADRVAFRIDDPDGTLTDSLADLGMLDAVCIAPELADEPTPRADAA